MWVAFNTLTLGERAFVFTCDGVGGAGARDDALGGAHGSYMEGSTHMGDMQLQVFPRVCAIVVSPLGWDG